MFPVIFSIPESIPLIGGLTLYTYGLLVAAAFLVGVGWTLHEAKLAGVDRGKIADLTFYVICAALVGSRIMYVFIEHERYLENPLDILKIWEGGLVFYGGLVACVIVSWWYTRREGLSLILTADLFMPGVALGHSIGRLGCLAAGCCFGKAASGNPWWAIVFPYHDRGLAPAGIPLYPTQIMESLAALLVFGILVLVRRGKKFTGRVFLVYLVFYGLLRLGLEAFRSGSVRGYAIFDFLSTAQVISILVVALAGACYYKLRSKGVTK